MHGEFEEMVLYHAVMIKIMLGVLVIGMVIPFLSNICNTTIKRMRIYMFVAHGVITSVAFSGMVAFVFVQMSFNLSMAVMMVVYVLISVIETLKYLKMLKIRHQEAHCVGGMRTLSLKYTLINIAMVASLVIWKIVEHHHAVPLS